MRRLIGRFLTVVGAVTVLVALLALAVGLTLRARRPGVPARTILELDLERGLVEHVPDDPIARFRLGSTLSVRDVVEGLARAARDDRVVALFGRIGAAGLGLAQRQEVRDAIGAFRAAGKPAVAFGETFGEFGPGSGAYYVATAFDQIYLQPSGDIGLTAPLAQGAFLRGTLDKLGVVPRLDHRREYKSAMNILVERAFTPAHREATRAVMESQLGQIARGVATARQLPEAEVRALVDRGPFLGDEAVGARLVDGMAYRDGVRATLEERVGKDAEFLSLRAYLARAEPPADDGPTIALIYGVGGVQRGRSRVTPAGEVTMGSDTVTAALRDATRDDDVRAILFRIDSPGGSYVASDTIWRETIRAKEAGKPIVVSMGNVAGSGGYFVAMAANKIVAQPGTITGSIGVLGGKLVTTGLWEKLGVSFDDIAGGPNATMWSSLHDYTPAEWARIERWLDRVYDDFTRKVAQGRRLPLKEVLAAAKGRIWTGEEAKARGLVDELGGYTVALRLAREAAGLAPDAPVQLRVFPREKSLAESVLARVRGDDEDEDPGHDTPTAVLAATLEAAAPALALARQLGLGEPPGLLAMPAPDPTGAW